MSSTVKAVEIRNNYGLELSRIERLCPSVFAAEAHQSRSEQYLYIPTKDILQHMYDELGLVPVQVIQAGARDALNAGYTKHLVRLRHRDDLGERQLQQETHEILLRNSHNGGSGYEVRGGVYRLVCSNGMIVGDESARMSIHHRGHSPLQDILNATYKIVELSTQTMEHVEEMKQISLIDEERMLFARYAFAVRFGLDPRLLMQPETRIVDAIPEPSEDGTKDVEVFHPGDLLRTRRSEDRDKQLWTTLNVVQENATQRGTNYQAKFDRKGQRHRLRPVKGIDQNVKINELVWSFAEELRKLHSPT